VWAQVFFPLLFEVNETLYTHDTGVNSKHNVPVYPLLSARAGHQIHLAVWSGVFGDVPREWNAHQDKQKDDRRCFKISFWGNRTRFYRYAFAIDVGRGAHRAEESIEVNVHRHTRRSSTKFLRPSSRIWLWNLFFLSLYNEILCVLSGNMSRQSLGVSLKPPPQKLSAWITRWKFVICYQASSLVHWLLPYSIGCSNDE